MFDREALHLIEREKWYKGKRPKLQIDILSCLVLGGPISKGQAEKIFKKSHSDIVESFQKLETIGFIEKTERIEGRGRHQNKFKITEKGLEAMLNDEFINPVNFWKIFYGYVLNSDKAINETDIQEYFKTFLGYYLKYNNQQGIDSLDIFYNMSKKWMDNFVISKNMIHPVQKIFEILSLYPKISFNELVKKSKLNPFAVCEVLNTHTMECYPPRLISSTRCILPDSENIIGKKDNEIYWNFMQHNLIKITKNSRGEKIYELSLFGIILVFKLIRFLYGRKEEKKIFFGNITYFKYFEKIIDNYNTKLPLIFGKWNLLKRILKDYAICNFDKIIDEYFFEKGNISVSRGGNNEFFYSIREIILHTRQQLTEFHETGKECLTISLRCRLLDTNNKMINNNSSNYLDNHYPLIDKSNIKKISYPLVKSLFILQYLSPIEIILTNPEVLYEKKVLYAKNGSRIREALLNEFEDSFADSITAFYYFNLHCELDFFYIMRTHWNKDIDVPHLSLIPKDCLNQIIKLDNDITNFCQRWYDDITNLQNSINNHLKQSITFK